MRDGGKKKVRDEAVVCKSLGVVEIAQQPLLTVEGQ